MRHLSLLLIVTFLFSCGKKTVENKEEKAQLVKVFQVREGLNNNQKIATGVSIPQKEVQMSFRVSGPLVKFDLDEGQKVVKGQVLGQIDQRDFIIELRKAKAAYNLTKTTKERAVRLFQNKNISEQAYDKAILDYEQASSNLNLAENALKDTKLIAPFTGRIKQLKTEIGEHVSASQTVIVLQDFTRTRVRCTVPEELVYEAKNQDRVSVVFDSKSDKRYWAKVIEVLHDTEQLNYAYPMLLEVESPNETLIAGMTAEVYFQIEEENNETTLLPTSAIIGDASGERFVWGVEKNTQQLKKVRVQMKSLKNDNVIEVKMLDKSDWIVATGGVFLNEGQKVRAQIEDTMISKN